jgi:hypothetical protein
VSSSAPPCPSLQTCIKIVVREGDAIYESADWKEVMKDRPELVAHLAIEAFRVLNKKG